MKKILLTIFLILALVTNAFAGPLLLNGMRQVATGTIAAGSSKIDLTTANAFAEFGVDLTSYQDGKHMIQLYNTATGYGAWGWISGTAPAGETLSGTELVTNGTFDVNINGWNNNNFDTFAWSAGKLALTGLVAGREGWSDDNISLVAAQLYKYSVDIVTNNNIREQLRVGGGSALLSGIQTAVNASVSGYYTAVTTENVVFMFQASTIMTGSADNVSVQRVTDVAITGALITSAKGVATRGWPYAHVSFNPNLASTFKIFKVN
jgi:uncharacterized protein YneR